MSLNFWNLIYLCIYKIDSFLEIYRDDICRIIGISYFAIIILPVIFCKRSKTIDGFYTGRLGDVIGIIGILTLFFIIFLGIVYV